MLQRIKSCGQSEMKVVFAVLKTSDVSEDVVGVLEDCASGRIRAGREFPIHPWSIEGSDAFSSEEATDLLRRDYLYPAAAKAGLFSAEVVQVKRTVHGKVKDVDHFVYKDREGRRVTRFGFHNFRHSLSSFLTVTAQRMLRQSNAAFTLNRYTQTDMDELVAAQQMMLDAIFVDQSQEPQ